MSRTFHGDLARNLADPEYAKVFGAELAKTDFALVLASARRDRGLTQTVLAEKLGVNQSYVAKLEGGEANPTLGTVGGILATMGLRLAMRTVSLFDLLDEGVMLGEPVPLNAAEDPYKIPSTAPTVASSYRLR